MKVLLIILSSIINIGCTAQNMTDSIITEPIPDHFEIATLGAGCFWCVEAIFSELKGVQSVTSGYMGGEQPNPTYKEVCTGKSGYAEVAQLVFDPSIISFEDILYVFFTTHDPTTWNRQGADKGTQYRSVIFYHNDLQRDLAIKVKQEITDKHLYKMPIITAIEPASIFYTAESYHQNYYQLNPNQGYCRAIITPKVIKFRKKYQHLLRTN